MQRTFARSLSSCICGFKQCLSQCPAAMMDDWTIEGPNSLAPYLPSSWSTIDSAMSFAGVKPSDTFLDIGCGDGRTLIRHIQRGGALAVGIEINTKLIDIANEHIETTLGKDSSKVRLFSGSYSEVNLRDSLFTQNNTSLAIFCFLLPQGLAKIEEWLHHQVRADKKGLPSQITLTTLGWSLPSSQFVKKKETTLQSGTKLSLYTIAGGKS